MILMALREFMVQPMFPHLSQLSSFLRKPSSCVYREQFFCTMVVFIFQDLIEIHKNVFQIHPEKSSVCPCQDHFFPVRTFSTGGPCDAVFGQCFYALFWEMALSFLCSFFPEAKWTFLSFWCAIWRPPIFSWAFIWVSSRKINKIKNRTFLSLITAHK